MMTSGQEAEGSFFYVLDEGANLLFADDDPILREFANVHLATDSAEVLTAEDGEDAWEKLQTHPVDLLLVDLEMPRLDGFGLVRRLRADPRFALLPVIVVTGREDVAAIDRAFNSGATSFIVKPINWRLLSYQVRFILRSHRAEASLRDAEKKAGAEEARTDATLRLLLRESAQLLDLAMRGDVETREAARRYGELLGRMAGGRADPAPEDGRCAA
jgi:DNA-binding response OmpR family regulator